MWLAPQGVTPDEQVTRIDPVREEGEDAERRITQQQAAQRFCLSLQSLRDAAAQGLLTVEERPNPHGATFSPMRLYRFGELQQLAWRVWGGPQELERELERRREQRWQVRQKRVLGSVVAPEGSQARGDAHQAKLSRQLRRAIQPRATKKRSRVQPQGGGALPQRRKTPETSKHQDAQESQQSASRDTTPRTEDLVWEVI
ncbi:hypothetical protein BESB_012460 [Besnoitia besnoiti]|uniref:XPA C-terminal domain-containing protein n=1 Tax=Besnoitia besnoiti TaxID=94643 RepID=A0A2A9M611_BESBE|nr:hypothetical protein BESB_012460 [Besnoitia besnoiti]PFH32634.1 hypothetical protein BESB_012460 [Besnoitia besnoiti]